MKINGVAVFVSILAILCGGIYYYNTQTEEAFTYKHVLPALADEIQVSHPKWNDMLVPDGRGRVFRKNTKEYANILELSADKITIDWDDWGIETFKKDHEGVFQLSTNN